MELVDPVRGDQAGDSRQDAVEADQSQDGQHAGARPEGDHDRKHD
jgi:hypothetical protein